MCKANEAPRRRLYCMLAGGVLVGFAAPLGAAESERVVEEIVVVGSRIVKPDYAYSNPVLSVDAEAIKYSGTTDLVSYLKEIPALSGSLDSNDAAGPNAFIGGTGLSLLDLRNLGVDRTLVLVDGRRHVASLPGSSAVDIDTIPIDLIERVEVLTGGASAIYGADGVTGVVNFKMKDDFEGLSIRTQAGTSAESDSDSALVAITGGKNFFEGRTNVAVALEYSRNDRLEGVDRDFAAGGDRKIFMQNPDDPGTFDPDLDDPAIPDRIPLRDMRYADTWRGGAVDVANFDGVPEFVGEDLPWDGGLFVPDFYQQGGSATPVDDYVGDLLPREERVTLNTFVHHDLNDRVRFFGELKYSRNESLTRSQPTFDYYLWVDPDNAFIPANIGSAFTPSEETPALLVSRDNFDLGVRGEDITRETWRTVAGLEGDLGDHFRWETSYVYGRTDVDNDVLNTRINDRFAAAIDAVAGPGGQPVCRSDLDPTAEPANISWNLDVLGSGGWNRWEPLPGTWAGSFSPGAGSGCVPVNLFGDGSVSREAKAWLTTTTHSESELEQHVVQAFVAGDLEQWFTLPAGAVSVVFGGEYREEESSDEPSSLDRAGLTFGNVIEPTKGDYDVTEVFAEIDIPLLQDAPFARELSIDGAFRYSDYSTIGNADTWKVGMVWQPMLDVTFRGTVAEATRSPNISELFSPGGQTFLFIEDPCDANLLQNGTQYRADNCATVLTAVGADPTDFNDLNEASISGILQGNEDLAEEVAETFTVGVIIQPRFAEELTISVDYYDIELTDAINTADPQTAADLCVDLPTTDNDYCTLFEREEGTGRISGFTQQPFNVAEFTTRGYDFTVEYTLEASRIGLGDGMGLFDFRLVGNKLTDLTFVELPGADPNPNAGEEDAPEWQYTFDLTWQREPFLVNYGISYFSQTQRYTKQVRASNPDITTDQYEDYDERFVQDLHGEYTWQEGMSLYAGVNNLMDEQPDVGETFYPVSAVGRFYYLGLTFHWQ